MPYEGDSFFTLTLPGQVGLAFLSLCLAAGWLWATWRLTRGHYAWVRLGIAAVAFALFDWLSPQIYYTYYMALLGVPAQIIIGPPPLPDELGRLLTFSVRANLSFHSRGFLGWALLLMAAYPSRRKRP
ncbi:MAG: hypothetical protein AAFO70_02000 [Pseudomonadota bacterium]